jgi:hypothetical protein
VGSRGGDVTIAAGGTSGGAVESGVLALKAGNWSLAAAEFLRVPAAAEGVLAGVVLTWASFRTARLWLPTLPALLCAWTVAASEFTLVVTVLPAPQRAKVLDLISRIEGRTGITFVLLIALFAFGLWRMMQGPGDF